MKDSFRKLKLNGREFLLINGDNNAKEGAIATLHQYLNGECSYAALRNREIMRYGEQIGTIDDIEFLEIVEIEIPNIVMSISKLSRNFLNGREGF